MCRFYNIFFSLPFPFCDLLDCSVFSPQSSVFFLHFLNLGFYLDVKHLKSKGRNAKFSMKIIFYFLWCRERRDSLYFSFRCSSMVSLNNTLLVKYLSGTWVLRIALQLSGITCKRLHERSNKTLPTVVSFHIWLLEINVIMKKQNVYFEQLTAFAHNAFDKLAN